MAGDRRALMTAIDDEVMALGLPADRFIDGGIEKNVGFRGSQRSAQIGSVLLAEAHVERARASDPHAIAGFAEIMRKRRDEAEPAASFRNAHIARWTTRSIVNGVELIAIQKLCAHDRERQILANSVIADLAERHHLDQRQ